MKNSENRQTKMINNKYKILNEVLIEWDNSSIEDDGIIKTYDVSEQLKNYFVYEITGRWSKPLQICSTRWENYEYFWWYSKIFINGELIKLSSEGRTVNMYEPGTYTVEIQGLDKQKLTSCKYMFYECKDLVSVPLFDTSRVTNMYGMFYNCKKLTKIPQFNTENVEDTVDMFAYTNIESAPEFNMKNLKRGAEMFWECQKLKTVPLFKNLDLFYLKNFSDKEHGTREHPLLKLFWKCFNLDEETRKIWNPSPNGTPRF